MRQTAKGQDRVVARRGLDECCLFCQEGPWAWAYPMRRSVATPEGGDMLFPAYIPVCAACHASLLDEDEYALNARLWASNRGRAGRPMREMLPVFVAARNGVPLPRVEAPHLDRQVLKGS